MSTISVGAKLRQMAGLVGTKDLSDWENRFLSNVLAKSDQGRKTSLLTENQLEKVDELYGRHFPT